MKKEEYKAVEFVVYVFEEEDVITSSPFNPDKNEGPPVVG